LVDLVAGAFGVAASVGCVVESAVMAKGFRLGFGGLSSGTRVVRVQGKQKNPCRPSVVE
jgi:hypothetical protein